MHKSNQKIKIKNHETATTSFQLHAWWPQPPIAVVNSSHGASEVVILILSTPLEEDKEQYYFLLSLLWFWELLVSSVDKIFVSCPMHHQRWHLRLSARILCYCASSTIDQIRRHVHSLFSSYADYKYHSFSYLSLLRVHIISQRHNCPTANDIAFELNITYV